MFVTGLEFLPVALSDHTVTSIAEAAVVSISVDNQVCIHSLSYRSKLFKNTYTYNLLLLCLFLFTETIPAWLAIVIIIITLFLTFLFCSYLGL